MRILKCVKDFFRRCFGWKPDKKKRWVRGLKKTRIPGIKDACKDDISCCERLFWFIVFFLLMSFAIVLSLEILNQYWNRPILHAFRDGGIPIDQIPFPAITVSSPNLFKKSVMDDALEVYWNAQETAEVDVTNHKKNIWNLHDAVKLLQLIDHFCEADPSYAKKFNAVSRGKSFELHNIPFWKKYKDMSIRDNIEDNTATQKLIPFVQKGLINCSAILTGCLWQGSNRKSCRAIFGAVQTNVGTGCSFNKMPDEILRSDNGLKSILHKHGAEFQPEMDKWNQWANGNHSFFKDKDIEHNNEFPRRQIVSGFKNGISHLLVYDENSDESACPMVDGEGYIVSIHHPFEEPLVIKNGFNIGPGYEVFIKVRAQITQANPNIGTLSLDKRKCYLDKENPLKQFRKYTKGNCYKECLAKEIEKTCRCHPLKMTAGKNETICSPMHRECVNNATESFMSSGYRQRCINPTCYSPCNEIIYTAEASHTKLRIDMPQAFNLGPNSSYSLVHVFFDDDSVLSRERSLLYDNYALIGLFGGVIGFTNGIDVINIFYAFSGLMVMIPICACCRRRRKRTVDVENPPDNPRPTSTSTRDELIMENELEHSTTNRTKITFRTLGNLARGRRRRDDLGSSNSNLDSILVVPRRQIQDEPTEWQDEPQEGPHGQRGRQHGLRRRPNRRRRRHNRPERSQNGPKESHEGSRETPHGQGESQLGQRESQHGLNRRHNRPRRSQNESIDIQEGSRESPHGSRESPYGPRESAQGQRGSAHGRRDEPKETPREPRDSPRETPDLTIDGPRETQHGPRDGTRESPHGPSDSPRESPNGPIDGPRETPHGPRDGPMKSPHGSSDSTRESPNGPIDGPRETPHEPRESPHGPRDGPIEIPHGSSDSPMERPNGLIDGPRETPHGPRKAPLGPRETPHEPRESPHGPRDGPIEIPHGSSDSPRESPPDGPRETSHKPRDRPRGSPIKVIEEGAREIPEGPRKKPSIVLLVQDEQNFEQVEPVPSPSSRLPTNYLSLNSDTQNDTVIDFNFEMENFNEDEFW